MFVANNSFVYNATTYLNNKKKPKNYALTKQKSLVGLTLEYLSTSQKATTKNITKKKAEPTNFFLQTKTPLFLSPLLLTTVMVMIE